MTVDDKSKYDLEYALSAQMLKSIIDQADINASSGDPMLALQGRQTSLLARIILNMLGTVDESTFNDTPAPVIEETPRDPTTGVAAVEQPSGTIVKSPDQLTGPAPAGPDNAALGPDTTDAPANLGVVANTGAGDAVDVLQGAPVPDANTSNNPDVEVLQPTPPEQPAADQPVVTPPDQPVVTPPDQPVVTQPDQPVVTPPADTVTPVDPANTGGFTSQ